MCFVELDFLSEFYVLCGINGAKKIKLHAICMWILCANTDLKCFKIFFREIFYRGLGLLLTFSTKFDLNKACFITNSTVFFFFF